LIPPGVKNFGYTLVLFMLLSEHAGYGQIIIIPKQRRCKMKISQAIESHKDYHSINSKKKYGEEL